MIVSKTSTTPSILWAYNLVFKKTTTKFASRAAAEVAAEKTAAAFIALSLKERLALGVCPHCGADGSITANGADGTVAGDTQLYCHSCLVAFDASTGEPLKKRAKGESSDAIKASWQDEEVRAARTKRDKVRDASGALHSSFAAALKAIGVTPVGFHRARLVLKAEGVVEVGGHKFFLDVGYSA